MQSNVGTAIRLPKSPSTGKWSFGTLTAIILLLLLTIGSAKTASAESPAVATETDMLFSADFMVEIQQLNQEIEPLRLYMGAPKANILDIKINNVAPHDVYFLAMTMFRKVNRLSFEITREHGRLPKTSSRVYKTEDVLALVQASHQLLDNIISEFGIVVEHKDFENAQTTPSVDIFRMILKTNRQLNLLLQQKFRPSDAYMQVTKAIGYATKLLTSYPDSIPIPETPPFVPNKSPGDVYFLLLTCLEELKKMNAVVHFPNLVIDASSIDRQNVTPSDVFDLTSLVVARLDYLYQRLAVDDTTLEAYYPGHKYPSDVYQRAGILKNQLQQLVSLTLRTGLPTQLDHKGHSGG